MSVPCRLCEGDARASIGCRECHGAGVSLESPDGFLVWSTPLDRFAFRFRRTRARVNTFFHAILALSVLACFGAAILGYVQSELILSFSSLAFWTTGHWFVTVFWLGLILLCFLIFRVRVFGSEAKSLPTWGKTKQEIARMEAKPHKQARDISVFSDEGVWDVLEKAFDLAEQIGKTEVKPLHLFVGALMGPAGGIFITRVGMDIENVRAKLVPLLQQGQAGSPTHVSAETKTVLLRAYLSARRAGRRHVGAMDLFHEAFDADPQLQETLDAAGYPPEHVRMVSEWIRLQERMREEHDRFTALAAFKPNTAMNRVMTARATPLLNELSEDLTVMARNGHIAPVVHRDKELEEVFRVMESGKRAVVLVGEVGVGKTSVIDDLARHMVEEDVPRVLFDRRLVSVNLAELVAGGDVGHSSERLLALLNEVALSGNIVLVLEGIEALSGGGSGGPMDLAEAFASEIRRLNLYVVATTTPQAWGSFLERRSLGAMMGKVLIAELTPQDAERVLMTKAGFIEYQNRVFFSYAAIQKAVELAGRFLRDQRLPESAIVIAKEAAVLVHNERGEHAFVTADDMARIVHEKTNIPVEAVSKNESEKLLHLEEHLHHRVIGQVEAVTAVAQAMRRARAEVREGKRPIANFLFLGPTGVGKTELSKALAAEYFGSDTAMIRMDMSELQHPSAVSRVIGMPGDERGGWLTEQVRKNPFAIVLLDELEKAHPDILTLFLQVMDDGRLTDGVGRTVDFTNVVLIATSNAGTPFIQESVKANMPVDQIKTAMIERELKGTFRPEFLNRFDAIIIFKPLTLDDVTQIGWLMINGIAERLLKTKGIIFHAEDEAVEALAQEGFDPLFGARPLRRVIQEKVENGLADLLLRSAVGRRDSVLLKANGSLEVKKAG